MVNWSFTNLIGMGFEFQYVYIFIFLEKKKKLKYFKYYNLFLMWKDIKIIFLYIMNCVYK